jgi:hypothetical protein
MFGRTDLVEGVGAINCTLVSLFIAGRQLSLPLFVFLLFVALVVFFDLALECVCPDSQ